MFQYFDSRIFCRLSHDAAHNDNLKGLYCLTDHQVRFLRDFFVLRGRNLAPFQMEFR